MSTLLSAARSSLALASPGLVASPLAHRLNEPYFVRRRRDCVVRQVLCVEPPPPFEIKRPEG